MGDEHVSFERELKGSEEQCPAEGMTNVFVLFQHTCTIWVCVFTASATLKRSTATLQIAPSTEAGTKSFHPRPSQKHTRDLYLKPFFVKILLLRKSLI